MSHFFFKRAYALQARQPKTLHPRVLSRRLALDLQIVELLQRISSTWTGLCFPIRATRCPSHTAMSIRACAWSCARQDLLCDSSRQKTDMSWSTPRRPTTVPVHRCPSFTFTTAFLIHAIRGYLREDYRKSWLSPAVNGYNDFADYIPK